MLSQLDWIYILILVAWILLLIAFIFKDYAIGAIASMFLMIIGIFITSSGLPGVDVWLYTSLGIIHLLTGGYVFAVSGIEEFEGFF